MIAVIVFFERAQRRLLIQYPKRQVGNKMFQGDTSHLPLKLNTSGVIPVIFGSSLLLLPATIVVASPRRAMRRSGCRSPRRCSAAASRSI